MLGRHRKIIVQIEKNIVTKYFESNLTGGVGHNRKRSQIGKKSDYNKNHGRHSVNKTGMNLQISSMFTWR